MAISSPGLILLSPAKRKQNRIRNDNIEIFLQKLIGIE
jgi:hypothetical protein